MPAAATIPTTTADPPARRRYTRRDDPNRTRGLATRARLHAAAWAAHGAGEHPTLREFMARMGLGRTTVDFHTRMLTKEGRWPWPARVGTRQVGTPRLGLEAAHGLAADPESLAVARRISGVAARRMPWLTEEYESAAMAALWDAAMCYDGRDDVPFVGFAAIRIRGALRHVNRLANGRGYRNRRSPADRAAQPAVLSMGTPIGGGQVLGDLLAADEMPVGWEVEAIDEVEHLAAQAAPEDGRVMLEFYTRCDRATIDSIAKDRGTGWDTANGARRRAQEAVRRYLREHGRSG